MNRADITLWMECKVLKVGDLPTQIVDHLGFIPLILETTNLQAGGREQASH